MNVIASIDNKKALYVKKFERLDLGYLVPDDGYQYIMVQHEWPAFGTTRHSENQQNQTEPRPAVVNTKWGIKTLATNGDYHPINDPWQIWFYQFWDKHSGYLLPKGEKIGTYVNPKNPNIVYTRYTPGSKLALYAGMIMDAKSHTDSASPETGARDAVTGRNLSNNKPWEWLCRPTTGALLRVLNRSGNVYKVEAIDLLKPPPNVDNLPIHLFYFGTQVFTNGVVSRYPDVKEAFAVHGYPPVGTAMPLVAPGGYFYINRKDSKGNTCCVELQAGQFWKPYYP